jgi:hypothetical protein
MLTGPLLSWQKYVSLHLLRPSLLAFQALAGPPPAQEYFPYYKGYPSLAGQRSEQSVHMWHCQAVVTPGGT